MIKYVVGWSKDDIEKEEIIRETEKCVFVASGRNGDEERRLNKLSDYASYYDTWEEAYAYLIGQANSKVKYAEISFKRACDERVKIESLKNEG